MPELVRYEIEHASHYEYDHSATRSVMWLCLQPRVDFDQSVRTFEIVTEPRAYLSPETDSFGNNRHVVTINFEHDSLRIIARSEVETVAIGNAPKTLNADVWDEIARWRESFEHWEFTHESPLTLWSPALEEFVDNHDIEVGSDPVASLLQLSTTLHASFNYEPGSTRADSTIDEILNHKNGVCQDYTHVMIAIARSWGIPTRYVSGYMHTTGMQGEQTPESAMHAWVECLLPDIGWIGIDPTNDTVADERHVRVAIGRDYLDVSPTRGIVTGGGTTRLEANVTIVAREMVG